MAQKSMVQSSDRKEKLKQLIESLSDEKVEALTDQLVNSMQGEYPNTYKLYGDTDPSEIKLDKTATIPRQGATSAVNYNRDSHLTPLAWAESLVDVAESTGGKPPSHFYWKGKIYSLSTVDATPSPRRGVPGTPAQTIIEENIF